MMIDQSGRGMRPAWLGVLGVAFAAAISSVVYLLGLRYTGAFDDDVAVTAVMTSTGDGLPELADVKFRGMLVGSVADVGIAAKGERQNVRIDLKSDVAMSIPETVTARVVPANIFGVTAIELVDNGAAPRGLREGATIRQDTSAATTQLQTTLTTLRTVLDSIQPEKLGRVLGTLADALDPAARAPGSTIERLDAWTTRVRATPGIGELLGDLGAAAAAVDASAPELVEVLEESITAARTITERRAGVIELLTSAGGAVDATNRLFAANPDAGKELVIGLDETFGALAADPDAIAVTAANLDDALGRLATVFNWGPSKQMAWVIDVSFTPFEQYTARDCPHYGTLPGPRCGTGSVPDVPVPQEFPPNLLPRRVEGAGPALPELPNPPELPAIPQAPMPGLPQMPALPQMPWLPSIPGFPQMPGLPQMPGAPQVPPIPGSRIVPGGSQENHPAVSVGPLRGVAAIAALTGGTPSAAQWLLLGPVLADGAITVSADPTAERGR
ncbi:virulence factor Mce family protein [Nocardia amikacinitolerans]|uniref:MCE family protein n=1 Tax=Nocardia amikacinitolerans TaxID=756689 RepID=UPI00083493C4|nr:MCE family protein [Nocardia amikacinitolerans]MCP2319994.1 virulence factor Mce family protein [Nocardia amikacinitolerans]